MQNRQVRMFKVQTSKFRLLVQTSKFWLKLKTRLPKDKIMWRMVVKIPQTPVPKTLQVIARISEHLMKSVVLPKS